MALRAGVRLQTQRLSHYELQMSSSGQGTNGCWARAGRPAAQREHRAGQTHSLVGGRKQPRQLKILKQQ